jgi:hypothetical protein
MVGLDQLLARRRAARPPVLPRAGCRATGRSSCPARRLPAHRRVSAGSGAGKSVLAQLIAVQILRRGGRVIILDRKGSHRWALGLDGVTTARSRRHARGTDQAPPPSRTERNGRHSASPRTGTPGAHPGDLRGAQRHDRPVGPFWADIREKSDPKKSPAVGALGELLFMGRSAKVHLLAIAQMLTARAMGVPRRARTSGSAAWPGTPRTTGRCSSPRRRCPARRGRWAGGRSSSAAWPPRRRSATSALPRRGRTPGPMSQLPRCRLRHRRPVRLSRPRATSATV